MGVGCCSSTVCSSDPRDVQDPAQILVTGRAALHQLLNAGTPPDADAVRVLYAVTHLPGAFTEGDAPDPATVVALQQRGIIRRRARAGYLELTDDARFSLAPEPAPDAR